MCAAAESISDDESGGWRGAMKWDLAERPVRLVVSPGHVRRFVTAHP
jgi:hypothetical protein